MIETKNDEPQHQEGHITEDNLTAFDGHEKDQDFWLEVPRSSSCISSRFELPLDINSLSNMCPVEYLSRHVSVNTSRNLLYKKVFFRYKCEKEGILSKEVLNLNILIF